MSDARALLRAKRAENDTKISHPYAAYTTAGQLRCTVCSIAIKNNATWNGHLGSKGHRTNVAALKSKEELDAKNAPRNRSQGVASIEPQGALVLVPTNSDPKISLPQENNRRVGLNVTDTMHGVNERHATSYPTFPDDFFSDPNRAAIGSVDEHEEEPAATRVSNAHLKKGKDMIDEIVDRELEDFKRSLNAMSRTQESNADREEIFQRATVFAEPVLMSETPEGFPELGIGNGEREERAVSEGPDERERQEKKDMDERELIMDRLMEEERAQEEADQRVAVLKERLAKLRQRREAKEALKHRTARD